MKPAPPPSDETERLQELQRLLILDTPAEALFDDLTTLAGKITQTPIALISLVDKERQWFKSRVGIDINSTPRELSFCAHAILHPTDIMEVEDASLDERFYDHPYVVNDPSVRFYAGAPLVTSNGYAIGTLCVIDTAPRRLDADQQFAIRVIARQVISAIEQRRVANDIVNLATEIEAKNKDLEAAQKRLLDASRVRSQFLSNMSHEFRTPINAITGLAEELIRDPRSAACRDGIFAIEESANRLRHVIDSVFDFANLDEGRLVLEQQTFSISAFIGALVGSYHGKALEKQLVFKSEVLGQIPERVIGDERRLRQVLQNLLDNAVRFTKRGHIVFSVQALASRSEHARLRFVIADSGVGISKAITEDVFEGFNQADNSPRRNHEGLGIGLTISKQIVKLMGGSIKVNSEPNRGSEFAVELDFELPAEKEPTPEAITLNSYDRRPSDKVLDGKRVLIAEDNLINQRVARHVVERLGGIVDLANSGSAALRAMGAREYDLILMDCQMPMLDGYETTELIRAHERTSNRHVPIIAMTANVLDSERQRCIACGMDDFVSKPINIDQVRQTVSKWIK